MLRKVYSTSSSPPLGDPYLFCISKEERRTRDLKSSYYTLSAKTVSLQSPSHPLGPEPHNASSQLFTSRLWRCNINLGEVLCPAVFVKRRVCGGCSVSRAHKISLKSTFFCISCFVQVVSLNTAVFSVVTQRSFPQTATNSFLTFMYIHQSSSLVESITF